MTVFLPAIAPVSLIILIGFLLGRFLTLDRQTLSKLAIYALSPALIGGNLYRSTLSVASALKIILAFAIVTLILYLLVRGLSWGFHLHPNTEKSLIATTLFANNGNLGLPLVAFTLGDGGFALAIAYLVASGIFIGSFAPALLRGQGWKTGLKLTLRLPIFWATLTGLILRLLKVKLPLRLGEGIEMLGEATIPLVLLLLGMYLAQTRFSLGRYELFACSLRLILAPAIAFGITLLLQLESLESQVFVLQASMPTAVNSLVFATEFGGDATRVAKTIVASTLLSLLTLPVVLTFLI